MESTTPAPCRPVTRMPACRPDSDTAGTSRQCRAIASSAADAHSPVTSRWSSSRAVAGFSGSSPRSRARRSSSSVVSPRADTTTTVGRPARCSVATRRATARTLSIVDSELPPYFCTNATTASDSAPPVPLS